MALGFGAILGGQAALAAPSQEDVNNARQEVAYAEMSVAQLEIQLSAASQAAADANVAAATAGEAHVMRILWITGKLTLATVKSVRTVVAATTLLHRITLDNYY